MKKCVKCRVNNCLLCKLNYLHEHVHICKECFNKHSFEISKAIKTPMQKEVDRLIEECLECDEYYFRCKCVELVEDMN